MANEAAQKSEISIPLYLAALAVTLCGVLTVAATLEDPDFTMVSVLLTLVGFVFSLGCRVLKIEARIVEWLILGLIVLAVLGTMSQRIAWDALMPTGVTRNDEKVAVLLCWGAILLSWCLLDDWTVLFTPLLAVASIGLVASSDVNAYVAFLFCSFVAATTFLLIHYHALRLRASASPPLLTLPSGQLTTQLGLAALCSLATIGLGGMLVVPLEAASKNLSLAGAIRRLSSFAPPSATVAYRFSDSAELPIGTGAGWSASPQAMMRVTPDDGRPHYWRGRTYDRYNGGEWLSTLHERQPLNTSPVPNATGDATFGVAPPAEVPDAVLSQRPRLTAAFDILGDTDQFYYAADPSRVTISPAYDDAPRYGEDGRLSLENDHSLGLAHYSVVSMTAPDPLDPMAQSRLRQAGVDYPLRVRTFYLGNMVGASGGDLAPEALEYYREAVRQALEPLPANQRTPIDEASAIRDWVASRCTYSLAPPGIDPEADHVYEFLAHTRRGYCDLFASSMAVLCRVAGIPARVATGFAPGQQDGAAFNLRGLDKHAWTEVYFPNAGWLTFDPTAGARTDGTIPNSAAVKHGSWQHFLRGLGPVPLILSGLILALLLYVAKTEGYDRWFARRRPVARSAVPSRSEIGRRYARMTRLLASLGQPRGLAETPGEYAARMQAFLESQGSDAPAPATVASLTAQFILTRYGAGRPPSEAQGQAMERALREFAAATTRLRLTRTWRRLRAWSPSGRVMRA